MRLSWPAHSRLRRTYFWIFPVEVLCLGQGAELDCCWGFEVREVLAAVLDDLLFVGVLACGEDDECLWPLAPFLVGDRDDCALQDWGFLTS